MSLWSRLRCYAWSVVPAWPVVLVMLAYIGLLLFNDQIEDAMLAAAQDWNPVGDIAFWFYAWNLVLALAIWFWGRLLLGFERPIPAGLPAGTGVTEVHKQVEQLVTWLPRGLGATIPLIAAVSFWRVTFSLTGSLLAALCAGLALGLLIKMTYYFPIFAVLLVLAVISSCTADNHQLSAVEKPLTPSLSAAATGPIKPSPSTLDGAYAAFEADPKRKLLIVATAGGGIGAAFWTAYALSKLHDEQDAEKRQFDNALFAVSGVSGGS